MANALADRLKDLGLRHGEKLGVAVATGLFLLCTVLALRKETIKTTPDEIQKAAQASDSNLKRREERTTIIEKLEQKGIKDTSFAKQVDEQVKTALVADNYKSAREWVTPEPGAGLIRHTPALIAPTELYAYPGRGGFLVYALDEKGNRIPEEPKKDQPKTQSRRRRRRAAGMGGMGGMGMMGMGQRKKARKSKEDIAREEKAERDRKEHLLKGLLAGKDQGPEDATKKDESAEDQGPPAKEIVKGYRWVALTGVLDHEKMRANYRDALKNAASAHPNYLRLDLQRQTLQNDGTWSEWENVDAEANLRVLDNLPELDEELAPENVRPKNLVDPLPFLEAGLWEKVHIASLVPKEKKEIPKTEPGGGMMYGRGGGMMGMSSNSSEMMMKMMSGGNSMADMMSRMNKMGGGRGMMGMMAGAGEGAGGMMGMMGGAGESVGDYWKSEEKRVMIRALDFTVKPDTSYRYRVRIVVVNPNYKREDAAYGVNTRARELKGPWSDQTDTVTMPPDVMPYAMGTLAGGVNSDTKVRFQVIRFNLADGVTVPRPFEAAPGEVLGEARTAAIPVSDGSGSKSHTIDFTTRQVVLDVEGGGYQQLPGGMVGPLIERPVLTLLLRPDGSVTVHNEAEDIANEVRKDVKANYDHEIAESNKERKNSVGTGMMGMMGRMMGMMGGGMGGGGMMRGAN